MGDKNISVCKDNGEGITNFHVTVPCRICHHEVDGDQYMLRMSSYCGEKEEVTEVLCKDCLGKLYNEIGRALHKSVELNDTVYELVQCDDGVWRIFPMVVKAVRPFGSIRQIKGKEPQLWNIYAESDSTKMYKNFYEEGKSWFVDMSEALAALEEKTGEKFKE